MIDGGTSLITDDYVATNNVKFYFDYKDGKYGYNTSSSRGADTFSPFKSSNPVMYEYVYCESIYPSTIFTLSEQPATWFAFCKNSDGYSHIGYWSTEQNINTYVRTGNNSWFTGTISFNGKTVTLSFALSSQSSDIYVMYDY